MRRGIAGAVGLLVVLAALLMFCGHSLDDAPPSPALLRTLAQVGVGLLIAYSVAFAGVEKELSGRGSRAQHEDWLGFVAGCGICSLLGIATALVAASHREAGHANLADQALLWWSVGSIGLLGIVVASLPILRYEWRKG
jgi:hypothetical protein